MLKNTFVHIKGVGSVTERKIWDHGIRTWEDYIKQCDDLEIPDKRKMRFLEKVRESIAALKAGDHGYFASALPVKENWRAYGEFKRSTVFLDIETTGLGFERHDITVIGMYDGRRISTYVKGINLDDFQFDLPKYCVLVTFNGSRFDVPFIQSKYPNVRFDQIHIDLRFLLRRLGLTGGLKSIEEQLGVKRATDVKGMRGVDAVRMWREYERGNDGALRLLIKYNSEDIRNLQTIMEKAYRDMKKNTLRP